MNSARGMSAVFRPANHIHWSRFTVGTDKKKREMIIHVSVINGPTAPINPNQVMSLNSWFFNTHWDLCQQHLFKSELPSNSCLMLYADEKFTTEPRWRICVLPGLGWLPNAGNVCFCCGGVQAQFTAIMGPLLEQQCLVWWLKFSSDRSYTLWCCINCFGFQMTG